jgi:metal-sulfur cluster biosynthetic enzyme
MNVELADAVSHALRGVFDPCSINSGVPISIIDMGLVLSVDADEEGHVQIDLRPTTPMCTLVGSFMEGAERVAREVQGVTEAVVRIDGRPGWSEADMTEAGRTILGARRRQSRVEVPVRPREWEDRTRPRGAQGHET